MLAMMPDTTRRHIDSKIALATWGLGFERLWAALLWPVLIAGSFAALVMGGVLPLLPDQMRFAVLGGSGLGFLWSLFALRLVAWPSRFEAMRRIESRSGLAHRPVSGLGDSLSGEAGDGPQQAIWEEHKLRQLQQMKDARAGAPRSVWRDLDATALRLPVGLALVASLLLGPGDLRGNLAQSLKVAPAIQAAPLAIDAWLKPPAYTAKPPLLLTSPAMIERLKTEPEIAVPENSTLALRISNGGSPVITFHEPTATGEAGPALKDVVAKSKTENGIFQSEAKLTRPLLARITDGNSLIAQWRVTLIPDVPPAIAISELPSGDASGTLTAKWKASDDYGVSAITSDISLADEQDGGTGFAGNGIFLYDPPKFPVTLRKANGRDEQGQSSASVAEHPWAGFMVELTLTANDAAGHATTSEKKTFRLPERLFIKPLAKALIEQRRNLILEPDSSGQVEQMLEALITYPKGLVESSGPVIAIAAVTSRLKAAASQDDVDQAVQMLWQIATGIEDGSMANARAELEAIRKELERALSEGASPERIAELMDKLRGAMDRYLQSLADETKKRMAQGGQPQQQGKMVTPEDLKKMLDMIEKLAESGANDAAKQMLSQLEDILRNLQPGMSAEQMQPQGDSAVGKMLDELSDLMRKQQGLMDQTQRLPQQGDGELSPQDGQEPGNQGAGTPDGLAGEQDGLAQSLERMLGELGRNGLEGPPSLGDAGKSMRGAGGSLRQEDRDGALQQQGDAMSKLREGAKGLAKQLAQQGMGQQGSEGRHGEARGDNRDPLGRPMASHDDGYGPDKNMLPSELAMRRARQILDMLRSKAGDSGLPRLERDYIDRLLRGLY